MKNAIKNLRNYLLSKYTVKQNNTVANGIMIAGVVVNILEMMNNPTGFNWPLIILSIVLVTIGAVYQALFVRCPVCGDKLKGKATKLMDRCPNCNHDLTKLPRK